MLTPDEQRQLDDLIEVYEGLEKKRLEVESRIKSVIEAIRKYDPDWNGEGEERISKFAKRLLYMQDGAAYDEIKTYLTKNGINVAGTNEAKLKKSLQGCITRGSLVLKAEKYHLTPDHRRKIVEKPSRIGVKREFIERYAK